MTDEVVPATGAGTEEPDDDEAEGQAILAIMKALKSLAPETRRRVTGWAVTKYGATTSIEHPLEKDDGAKSVGAKAHTSLGGGDVVDPEFAAMFDAAQPRTTLERTAVACFWVQARMKKNPFLSQDANTLLKDLGHQVRDITEPFDALRAHSPSYVIQLKKDGSHQQSRKLYRMTPAGLKFVTEALRTGAFASPDA
jgi:hypothetical protein